MKRDLQKRRTDCLFMPQPCTHAGTSDNNLVHSTYQTYVKRDVYIWKKTYKSNLLTTSSCHSPAHMPALVITISSILHFALYWKLRQQTANFLFAGIFQIAAGYVLMGTPFYGYRHSQKSARYLIYHKNRRYSAKKTCILEEPTNRSHPIARRARLYRADCPKNKNLEKMPEIKVRRLRAWKLVFP